MSKEKFGLRVRQFVAVFPGVGNVVANQAIDVQDTKVDEALTELKDGIKRLGQYGISSNALHAVHANLVSERNRALQVADKGKQIEELMKVKEAARAAAAVVPQLVRTKMTEDEVVRNIGLLTAAFSRLGVANVQGPDVDEMRRILDTLNKHYTQARSLADPDAREKAFAVARAAVRQVLAPFQKNVEALLNASVDLYALRDDTRDAIAAAAKKVKHLQPNDVTTSLAKRLEKVQGDVARVKMDGSADTVIETLTKAAAEAERIAAMATRGMTWASEGEVIAEKIDAAVQTAQRDPDSAEGKMMFALGGPENFKEMATKTLEQVNIAGADIRPLSVGDAAAIFNYTTGDFDYMNSLLYTGKHGGDDDKKQLEAKIEVTKQAMAKLPNYEGGMTMRGDMGRYDWQADFFVGNTFAIKAFWSTGIKMCFDWCPLQISVFGKTGKQVAAMSEKPKETEVLFAPGTKFKVLSMYCPRMEEPSYSPKPTPADEKDQQKKLTWFITVEEV